MSTNPFDVLAKKKKKKKDLASPSEASADKTKTTGSTGSSGDLASYPGYVSTESKTSPFYELLPKPGRRTQASSGGFVTVTAYKPRKVRDPNEDNGSAEPTPPLSDWKTMDCWDAQQRRCQFQSTPADCQYYHSEDEAVCTRCGTIGHIAAHCNW